MRRVMVFLLLGLFLSSPVWGQVPAAQGTPAKEAKEEPSANQPSGVHELTAQDVEAFFDGLVPLQLAKDDIAGATIIVVKDGKVLFSRGYGFADVEKRKPVSAEKTLFRPGSVSKLFTWTAVMQLVEQGKLDLDRDVNTYLDFQIPEAHGKPVTLKNLLTHTPGFDDQVKDLFTSASQRTTLAHYVKNRIPARIFPPGTTPAYSNYGSAVAGYVVERVSGEPFPQYVEAHIFKPLGMANSTFVQPLPSHLAGNMSNGYKLGSDKPLEFEIVGPEPAGSLSSSATDMARFMIAHLQEGQLGDARILRPETARLMHSRLFALDDAANGMAHGFYEESRNGLRIIGHAGDTICFHSDLHLVLEKGLGLFISYNSGGKGETSPRTLLWESFLDRYFPYTPPSTPAFAGAQEEAKAVSGSYMVSRRNDRSFLRAASLIGQATVTAVGEGMIEVAALKGPNGKPIRWQAVAPGTFREVNGQDSLIFKSDQNGRMQLIHTFPFWVFHRVGLWENQSVLQPVLVISLLIMLLTLLLWPVAALVRRHYGRKLELTPKERRLRITVRLAFALNLIFLAALTGLVTYGFTHLEVFSDRGVKWFYLIQGVGLLGALGTPVVLYNATSSWTNPQKSIWIKLQATFLALAALGFLWFAVAGNLLNFSSSF